MRLVRNLFNSSDVKEVSDFSQRFCFNSSVLRQRSECSQRFPLNSSEVKQLMCVIEDFILVVMTN